MAGLRHSVIRAADGQRSILIDWVDRVKFAPDQYCNRIGSSEESRVMMHQT
jgi:hypothetical protein